ncbi:membrane protein insertion efficiency factor YidD [Duganella sp. FT80W]|uniref:Membrane protein insertion efficiency factor YidD n=1 Tax=Duganella guangzhouensis TaxID=2666084 RepID=A0A6I2LBQ6_9BURK|nr:membrane protein insertion efficiency factor YidD [Duganella guangzhouensis]MRW93699.1 membrane protein insertion efficiency factor YidD [Duganella guangzhouensis]
MKALALAAIAFYQRYLSPLKGFSCAFRGHTGRDSCSCYGRRVIARYGVLRGLTLLNRRLTACGAVHRHHHPAPPPSRLRAHYRAQAGFCDVPSCDVPSCDLPSCHLPHLPCDGVNPCQLLDCASSCADGPSCRDWWRNRRRNKDDALYVRMPPPPGL